MRKMNVAIVGYERPDMYASSTWYLKTSVTNAKILFVLVRMNMRSFSKFPDKV